MLSNDKRFLECLQEWGGGGNGGIRFCIQCEESGPSKAVEKDAEETRKAAKTEDTKTELPHRTNDQKGK